MIFLRKIKVLTLIQLFTLVIIADAENFLQNADFSYISESQLPEYWGTGHWGVNWIKSRNDLLQFHKDWQVKNNAVNITVNEKKNKPNRNLRSCWVKLPFPDAEYTFSVYLSNSSGKGKVRLEILDAGGKILSSQTANTTAQNQRFSLTCRPHKSTVSIGITPLSPGKTSIKFPQLELGNKPSRFKLAKRYSQNALPKITIPAKFPLREFAGGKLKEKTMVEVKAVKDYLTVKFDCYSKAKAPVSTTPPLKDYFVWKSPDSVSVFISPYADAREYIMLSLDRNGNSFDSKSTGGGWDGIWKGSVKENENSWSAIFKIPRKLFIKGNDKFRVNFTRENRIAKENSSWSPTYGMFHYITRFGYMKGFRGASKIAPVNDDNSKQNFILAKNWANKTFIPFGVWSEGDIRRLSLAKLRYLKSLSCNTVAVQVRTSTKVDDLGKLLKRASQAELKVIPAFWVHGENFSKYKKIVTPFLRKFNSSKAVAAWIAMDEPDVRRASIEYQRKVYNFVKELVPNDIVYINYTSNQKQDNSLPTDISSMDQYPVPDMDIHAIPQIASQVRNITKPKWFCLQSAGHAYFSGREPTAAEMRWMTYASIVKGGVSGFIYFAQLPHSIKLHDTMKEIGKELVKMRPFFVGEPISVSTPGVWNRASTDKQNTYILLINPERHSKKVKLSNETLQLAPLECKFIIQRKQK